MYGILEMLMFALPSIIQPTPIQQLLGAHLVPVGTLPDAYCHHLHGLADRPCDPLAQIANRHLLGVEGPSWHRQLEGEVLQRGERYSLTIRHVPETT